MAVAQNSSFVDRSAVLRRLRNTLRTIFTRSDLSTLIVVCAIMVLPALALTNALDIQKDPRFWPVSLSQLAIVGVASVVFGFLLARSHYSELLALLMSAVYGIATIGALQLLAAPGSPIQRVVAVITRLRSALTGANGAFQDPFILILFLCTLFWFLGHNTAWHIFRIDRVWRAVVPPGIVLLINGLYNFGSSNLDFFLVIYVFLALLLVIRSHIDAREFDWYMNHVGYERNLRTWFFRSGAVAGAVILLIAWLLPTGSPEQNQKRFQQFINGDVLNRLNQLASKLFSPLEGQGVTTADYYGRDRLQLGGAIQLGDQVVMLVSATPGPRYYWKSRVFDTYSNGEWTSQRDLDIASQKGPLDLPQPPYQLGTRTDMQQRFTMLIGPSRLIYAAPQVRSVDIAAEADADYIDPQTKTLNPSVVRPMSPLQERDSYGVTSSISVASADVLRQAAQQYPPWANIDLSLSGSTAPRARALALQIVRDANAFTAYDKAKAIEAWLRKNIAYDEVLPTPPAGKDPIDWVLFEIKRAYCTYYASAMIVMLRSQGVPARMAAGFAEGTWDDASKSYMVRERDAHTWVEVYFPGAGWVEFEPTSAQQSLDRPDGRSAPPTSTPTPTPTPSPTPLPTATTVVQPQNPALQSAEPPSMTPTQVVTAVPSPTPLPLAVPPTSNTLPGILSLALIASVIIAVLSFVGVGLFWWIEYRGLDSLSPVARAYARMAIYARWLRIPASSATTPLERGRRIAREVPERSAQIVTITDMYINERYAPPHPATSGEEIRANRAWQATRWGMIRHGVRKLLRRKD